MQLSEAPSSSSLTVCRHSQSWHVCGRFGLCWLHRFRLVVGVVRHLEVDFAAVLLELLELNQGLTLGLVVLAANEEARFVVHDLCHALGVAELDARHVRWPERSVGSRDARRSHDVIRGIRHVCQALPTLSYTAIWGGITIN